MQALSSTPRVRPSGHHPLFRLRTTQIFRVLGAQRAGCRWADSMSWHMSLRHVAWAPYMARQGLCPGSPKGHPTHSYCLDGPLFPNRVITEQAVEPGEHRAAPKEPQLLHRLTRGEGWICRYSLFFPQGVVEPPQHSRARRLCLNSSRQGHYKKRASACFVSSRAQVCKNFQSKSLFSKSRRRYLCHSTCPRFQTSPSLGNSQNLTSLASIRTSSGGAYTVIARPAREYPHTQRRSPRLFSGPIGPFCDAQTAFAQRSKNPWFGKQVIVNGKYFLPKDESADPSKGHMAACGGCACSAHISETH